MSTTCSGWCVYVFLIYVMLKIAGENGIEREKPTLGGQHP